MSYQLLFSYKQDSSKEIFKALRKDDSEGMEQEVLLKVFLNENKTYREEFKSLLQVVSPYCVRLLGFENFASKKALILEYVKGISLFQLIETFSLNEKEIQHILVSIYKGLLDLSKQGVCHGDLSLDNVLIDEKAHIKLIDFGEANYGQESYGTPPFIAPELYHGSRATFLSDLFSLGIIESILKMPYPLASLKDMQLKDFESDSSLLSLDPKDRSFPYDQNPSIEDQDLKSLSYKVKDLLSVMESRRCPTLKNPELKTKPSILSFKFLILLFLLCFGMVSSQASLSSQGFLKIYTNNWFFVSVGGFQSYSPMDVPLEEGWHTLHWKNQTREGKKRIFISRGKTLFLKDNHFLIKE